MKFIAHRGLFQGPDKDKENNPDQICEALGKGFDVEIDLRCDESNNLFLGHDYNQYPISKDFLLDSIDRFWIHCKDLEALNHINLFNDKIIPESKDKSIRMHNISSDIIK